VGQLLCKRAAVENKKPDRQTGGLRVCAAPTRRSRACFPPLRHTAGPAPMGNAQPFGAPKSGLCTALVLALLSVSDGLGDSAPSRAVPCSHRALAASGSPLRSFARFATIDAGPGAQRSAAPDACEISREVRIHQHAVKMFTQHAPWTFRSRKA
jgi:hypothetical protein